MPKRHRNQNNHRNNRNHGRRGRKGRRHEEQAPEMEAQEPVTPMPKAPPPAPVFDSPRPEELAMKGEMTYAPKGGNNPEDIGANSGILRYDPANKSRKPTVLRIDNGTKFADPDGPYDAILADSSDEGVPDAELVGHAHEDHIGAYAHDLARGAEVAPVVYATPITQAFMEQSFINLNVDRAKWPEFRTIKPGEPFQVGDAYIMPVPVSHSIPGSVGFAISTPSGTMVHSSDYKADQTGPIGPWFDKEQTPGLIAKALKRYGHERVDVATIDSTRAYVDGFTPTEQTVKNATSQVVSESDGNRVVVGVMGRSLERILNLAKVAAENDRHLVVHGKSLLNSLQVLVRADEIERGIELKTQNGGGRRRRAQVNTDLNKINDILSRKVGSSVRVVEGRDQALDQIPDSKQLVIATGTQGETNAALPRAARGDNQHLVLGPNDVVIRSASVIPGNEAPIAGMDAGIKAQGVKRLVTTEEAPVHSSGHGYAADVDEYLEAVNARVVIPIHGSVELMEKNADRIESRAGELDLEVLKMRNADRLTIGEEVSVSPTDKPAQFIGVRNTVEDPHDAQFYKKYVYEPVDENEKPLGPAVDPAADMSAANDLQRRPGRRA
ncbi:MAG: ribonuclease J [Alphaproteobacteria bacterium]|nr:ribonuclease J [Alphaproteobacteria bacterium SS10]